MKRVLLFFCFATALLQGCAASSVKSTDQDELGELVEQGPVLDGDGVDAKNVDEAPAQNIPGADQVTQKEPEPRRELTCLVLGPGMAKAYAEVGVLQAMQEQLKSADCIVGVEMGAVIGALYADKRNINAVQWQLFKLKRELYLDVGFLPFGAHQALGKKMHQFFLEIFGKRTPKDLGLRFAALYTNEKNNMVLLRDDLPLADVLSASIALPGVFEAWKIPGEHAAFVSAAPVSALPIEIAQNMGAKKIFAINVLDDQEDRAGSGETEDAIGRAYISIRKLARLQSDGLTPATSLIKVDTREYQFWDFHKQQGLYELGRQAGVDFLAKNPPTEAIKP